MQIATIVMQRLKRWNVINLIIKGVLLMGLGFGCGWTVDQFMEQPIVYLKSGGQFTNYCQIGNRSDYDRVINVRNVATMRKVENNRLVIDGNLNILFKDDEEREKFINVWQ